MDLSKNSSREEILDYIKYTPNVFLIYFSRKPWAQPYIVEAVKESAKKSPFYFLRNLSHIPLVQPYIDEAAKEAAKKDPKYFLEKWSDKFPQGIDTALFALGGKNVSK